jgi:hypothetical protein
MGHLDDREFSTVCESTVVAPSGGIIREALGAVRVHEPVVNHDDMPSGSESVPQRRPERLEAPRRDVRQPVSGEDQVVVIGGQIFEEIRLDVLDVGVTVSLPLVKWLLAIPHYIVLFFLFIGLFFVWIISFFAVIVTARTRRASGTSRSA